MGRSAEPLPGLDGTELLRVWEHSAEAHPVLRGVGILASALPDLPVDPDELPVGACATLLLGLRVGTFGGRVDAVTRCPGCAREVAVEADAKAMLASLPAVDLDEPAAVHRLRHLPDDPEVAFRAPTGLDLLAASRCAGDEEARAVLVARCVSSPAPLTSDVIARVVAALATADPAADLSLHLRCADCEHEWSVPFDVADYFWAEIRAAAEGLLQEVDQLATRYAWSERDILEMSPARRRAYLDLP